MAAYLFIVLNFGKLFSVTKEGVPDISGKAIANLGYEDVKHLNPVFINDTIYVKTKVLDKRVSQSKNDRGIVYVETIAYNQNNVEVLSFRRKVLVKKKNV